MKVGLRTILLISAMAIPGLAQSTELPKQGLEGRVEFWKKVYTQYGTDDVIIHDRIHVNLIYDVAAKGDQDSKITAVQQALGEIRNNLEVPENLSAYAMQIRDAVMANGVPLTDASLTDLQD